MRVGLVGALATLALVTAGLGAPAAWSDDGAGGADRALNIAGEIVLRPPVGQGQDGRTLVPGVAAFTPAHPGAPVEVQRRGDRGWKTVAAGVQNAIGEFAFLLPVASASGELDYRAHTEIDGRKKPVRTSPTAVSPWRFVWGDEFEGNALGEDWIHLPIGARSRPCATGTPDTVQVDDGVARFAASSDPDPDPARTPRCPDGQFNNAHVGTSRTFTHGVFAARLRTQAPEGMHSSFWLYPSGPAPEEVPAEDLPAHRGVEIDVVEYFGDTYGSAANQGKTWSFLYWPRLTKDGEVRNVKVGGAQETLDILGARNLPSESYHVYSVEWTPTEYIFRVDGVQTMRVDQGVSQRPQMLRLSMLTSAWETPELTEGSLPASMDVDWVRVWQR